MSDCNDLIRCLECKSINPTLYTDRMVCCEPLVPEVLDTHNQMQFSMYGKIGRWCVRGCCDFNDRYVRNTCIR